jgi:cytochrome c peroxidase
MKKLAVVVLMLPALAVLVNIQSCTKEGQNPNDRMSDVPILPDTPYDYGFGNDHMATLGRVLFYDPALSLNNTVSCGSCHKQSLGFADNKQFSVGLEGKLTGRNTSSILNTSNSRFWDGRAANFEEAVLQPVQNHTEMKIYDLSILPGKLSQKTYYPGLFKSAFGDDAITSDRIAKALADFLENFVSADSKYDQFMKMNGKPVVFSGPEKMGFDLFFGKAMCGNCHGSGGLSGWSGDLHNIGLDMNYSDAGKQKVTGDPADEGKFIVPSLKNIALTAPYMHDGRFKTLREVIDHYSDNIKPHKNLSWMFRDISPLIDPLTGELKDPNFDIEKFDFSTLPMVMPELTEGEKKDLEAFLRTLTDPVMITDPKLSNPFVKR